MAKIRLVCEAFIAHSFIITDAFNSQPARLRPLQKRSPLLRLSATVDSVHSSRISIEWAGGNRHAGSAVDGGPASRVRTRRARLPWFTRPNVAGAGCAAISRRMPRVSIVTQSSPSTLWKGRVNGLSVRQLTLAAAAARHSVGRMRELKFASHVRGVR